MEGIKTIDDLVRAKGLTPDEKEQLKDIIEECKTREVTIREASEATRRNLETLSTNVEAIAEVMGLVKKMVEELREGAESIYLRMMPEGEFYRE